MPSQQQRRDTGGGWVPSWPRAVVGGIAGSARALVGKDPHDRGGIDGSVRTVATAFLANLVVAVVKYAAFFLSGSSALMAEAVHSTADTINQGLLLHGRLASRHEETPQHPFGYGQVRYFWAFVAAVVMFAIGSVVSIGHGVLALGSGGGHEITRPYIPLGGLTVGLLMDGWSFVTARRQAKRDKGERSYLGYVNRSRDPEVPVVLLEDSAALAGLLFAYVGVALAILTGDELWDALASIAIGLVLAVVAFVLAREMRSLLIGESAVPEVEDAIREILSGHPGVRGIVAFRTMHLGPADVLVQAKLCFDDGLRTPDLVRAIDELEDAVRDRVDTVRLVSLEPDVPQEGDVEVPAFERDAAGQG